MQPIGKLPVDITLESRTHTDIYSGVDRALLSWKAARELRILPECYPRPFEPPGPPRVAHVQGKPSDTIMADFPLVFDGQVKVMEFHIAQTEDAQPFCVRTPSPFPSRIETS